MPALKLNLPKPAIRTIHDMRDVLQSPHISYPKPLYLMYRDVCRNRHDLTWMRSHSIRYDITVIPPALLGNEYVKTKGHYHPVNPAGTGYPEVYEILEGQAHFLIQKENLQDIRLVRARTGDIVAIPPGYGHVTINPTTDKVLTMANLVSTQFSSRYSWYEKMHGAAYYESEGSILIKNPYYPVIPAVKIIDAPKDILKSMGSFEKLYDCIGWKIIADMLNSPERFLDFFTR